MKPWISWSIAGIIIVLIGSAAYASTRPGEPAQSTLGAGTQMGVVELKTDAPQELEAFYTGAVGLKVIARDETSISLGRDTTTLLRLVTSDADADNPSDAGLYHSAFLYPDRSSLAHTLTRMARAAPDSFAGAADHSVSEAFYFTDPDGNGVELYVDRPAEAWHWNQSGHVTMGSGPLDANTFIATYSQGSDPLAQDVVMGHVHLRVGNLAKAKQFYVDTMGFAVTSEIDGAVFFAANGYHHHLAANTWSSSNAGQRPDSRGLSSLAITMTQSSELDSLEARLKATSVSYERNEQTLMFTDPWDIRIIVRLK